MLLGKGISAKESSQSVWLGGLGFGGLQGGRPRGTTEGTIFGRKEQRPKGGEVCRRLTASRHRVWQLAILANIGNKMNQGR